jgi:hypothetical protein
VNGEDSSVRFVVVQSVGGGRCEERQFVFPPFPPPPITGRCSYSSLAGRPLDKLHNGANGLWNFDSYILKPLQHYIFFVIDYKIQILLLLTVDDTITSTQGLRTTGRSGGDQKDYVIHLSGTQALKRGSAAQSSLSYFRHSKQSFPCPHFLSYR